MGIRCSSCGGTEFKKIGNIYVCIFCGSKFTPSQLGIMEEDRASKTDIALSEDVKRLISLYEQESNPAAKQRYLNLILEMDPGSQYALSRLKRRY